MKPDLTVRFDTTIRYVGLFLFAYLFLLAAARNYNALLLMIIGVVFWIVARFFIPQGIISKKRINISILVIIFLGFLLRVIWVAKVPTFPISDFEYYYQTAVNFSKNIFPGQLFKGTGYIFLLSLIQRIYTDPLSGKILNILLSTLTIYLVYLIGSGLLDRSTGLLAAIFIAVLPSEINMVSVLGTEIISTTLLCASVFFVITGIKENPKLKFLFLGGLCLGMAYTTRSSVLFYLPVFLIFIIGYQYITLAGTVKKLGVFIGGMVSILLVLSLWYSISVHRVSTEIIMVQDSFPILSGTNIKARGGWSQEDAELYYSWPAQDRDRNVWREAIRRITSNPTGFIKFIPVKFQNLMSENTYGNTWSIDPTKKTQFHFDKKVALDRNQTISQVIYILILGLALYHFVDNRKPASSASLVVILFVIFTLIPHVILEVQQRYHHQLMPFVIIIAALGLREWEINFSNLHTRSE